MRTPFLVIEKTQNKAGIKCRKGTKGRRIDLDYLFSIIRQPRLEIPRGANHDQITEWKGRSFDLLCDVKARWIARDERSDEPDFNEKYFIIDLDHVGYENVDKVKEVVASIPFCVFSAQSCTDGVWALFRGTIDDDKRWEYLYMSIAARISQRINIKYDEVIKWFDDSTRSIGRIRYLAYDPAAIKGPAYNNYELSYVMDRATEEEIKDSSLYRLAYNLCAPVIQQRDYEAILTSPGMGFALGTVAAVHPYNIRMGVNNKLIPGNTHVIIASGSSTGKTYGDRMIKRALRETQSNVRIINPRTPQAFCMELSCIQCEKDKETKELKLKDELSSIMVMQDEFAAKRSNDRQSKIGVETYDAYIRQAIDGAVFPNSAINTRGEIYNGEIPFTGSIIQYSTVEATARALADDDDEDGRVRRTFYLIQRDLNDKECILSDNLYYDGELSYEAVRDTIRNIQGFGSEPYLMMIEDAEAFFIQYENYRKQVKDESVTQRVARLAATNAILSGRTKITKHDVKLGLAFYRIICASEINMEGKGDITYNTAESRWLDIVTKCFKRHTICSYHLLRKQKWLNKCPLHNIPAASNMKPMSVNVWQLWAMNIIQPAEEITSKTESKWQLFDNDNPKPMTDEDKEKYGIEIQSQPVTKTDTFSGNNERQKRSEKCQKMSVEDRRTKYVEKEITEIAKEIERLPQGARHNTAFNKLAKLAPDLDAVGWDREAGLTEAMSRSSLPQKEIESMIEQIANDKGSIVTSEPSKGLKNIQ